MSDTLKLVINSTPPSGNNYTRARVGTVHGRPMPLFYHTPEAKAWWKAVEAAAAGQHLAAEKYLVSFIVYFPPRSRMDIDNANKCVMDGLTKAGVIRDDRYVVEAHAYKVKVASDAEARTEIFIREAGQLNLLGGMPAMEEW